MPEPIWSDLHPADAYEGLQVSAMGAWYYDSTATVLDAESRYRLSWSDAVVVSGTQRLTLTAAAAGRS